MHSHTAKVVEWKLDEDVRYKPSVWGCTDCDELFDKSPSNGSVEVGHTHTSYVEGCFGCKAGTLQMSTGDANGGMVANGWTNRKWDNELKAYRDARAQGIQPDGTSMHKVRAALDASDKAGVAYGS